MFKTRVTEMLGIEYPIIAGGMMGLSTAEFAAAVSNAGGLGIITSANFTTASALREEIRKAKSLTDKPLGVNINLFLREGAPWPNDEFIEVVIEEGIKAVETSGIRSPGEYVPRLKEGNVKVMHKVTTVRHALSAERAGVDLVGIIGFEQGGAAGVDEVTTMVIVPAVVNALRVPVIAGGGIGDARGFVAALALGAEGVVIGTRFMATKECPVHPKFKEWLLRARENDTVVVERSIRMTHRALKNRVAEEVFEMEARGTSLEELLPLIGGEGSRRLLMEGDLDAGIAHCGQVVGLIDDIPTVKELIEGIVTEAKTIGIRLASLGILED
jgi:NAD(P)H-dependent flavin oxidoreductase YrpB (nitropropane dioxygenase family)